MVKEAELQRQAMKKRIKSLNKIKKRLSHQIKFKLRILEGWGKESQRSFPPVMRRLIKKKRKELKRTADRKFEHVLRI